MADAIQKQNQRSQEELNALKESHEKRKAKLQKQNEQELQRLSKTYSKKKEQVQSSSSRDLQGLQQRLHKDRVSLSDQAQRLKEKHAAEMKALQDRQLQQQSDLANRYKETYHQQQKSYTTNLEKARQQEAARLAEMRKQGQSEYAKQKSETHARLEDLREDYKTSMDNTRKQGEFEREKVSKKYEGEVQRLHKTGDKAVGSEKERTEKTLLTIKEHHDTEVEKNEQMLRQRMAAQADYYTKKMEEQDIQFRKMLANQRHEFERSYAQNSKLNEAALNHQEALVTQAMIQQKHDLIRKFGMTENSGLNHFKEFESKVEENDNSFTVHLKIPKEEKDSVNVIVKENQLVLSRQKAFNDEIDKDGRKLTMAANESFREVIPLPYPIAEKSVIKQETSDGIKVMIPKMTFKSGIS